MTPSPLPPGSTVSLTLNGIPAELYLRLLTDAAEAGRGLRAEVLRRLHHSPATERRESSRAVRLTPLGAARS